MRVEILDPPAYSLPYDDALASALAGLGVELRLLTSRFAYGEPPRPHGYTRVESFYRHARGPAGSPARALGKRAEHPLDMLRYRRHANGPKRPDLAHFQWLTLPRLDLRLLPRCPTVLTIHDPLERAGRLGALPAIPAAAFSRLAAIIVHSDYARERVVAMHGLDPARVRVIRHGAFTPAPLPTAGIDTLPVELDDSGAPVVLCYGLLRPYKGIATLLSAWREVTNDAQLWIVGRAMMDLEALRRSAPANVRFLTRFVTAAQERALFQRADIVAAPYERSDRFGFSGVLATALGAGRPILTSDVGGLRDVADAGAAELFPAGDPAALGSALSGLLGDQDRRARLAAAASAAAATTYSWDTIARQTLALYETILRR